MGTKAGQFLTKAHPCREWLGQGDSWQSSGAVPSVSPLPLVLPSGENFNMKAGKEQVRKGKELNKSSRYLWPEW